MWMEVKKAQSLMIAETWKELFEGEGVPTRIVPVGDAVKDQELAQYRIMVPRDKKTVVEEVLRKL